jgi:hypothetical protein
MRPPRSIHAGPNRGTHEECGQERRTVKKRDAPKQAAAWEDTTPYSADDLHWFAPRTNLSLQFLAGSSSFRTP